MKVFTHNRKLLMVLLFALMCYAMLSTLFIHINIYLVKERSFFIDLARSHFYRSDQNLMPALNVQKEIEKIEISTKMNTMKADQNLMPAMNIQKEIEEIETSTKMNTVKVLLVQASTIVNVSKQPNTTEKPDDQTGNVFQCPELSIKKRYEVPAADLSCKPRLPLRSGCKYAMDTYVYDNTINSCKTQPIIKNICNRFTNGSFSCSFDACGETYNGDIWIHIFDKTNGVVDVYEVINKSSNNLKRKVEEAAKHTMKNEYNFMFLSCGGTVNKTQFIVLPPVEFRAKVVEPTSRISINIFIYDSISRAHFYRSLKHSIEAMNDINTNSHKYHSAEVLDFELFQSIHGHSQENTYALMTGKTFPENISLVKREITPVKMDEFYKFLKKNGYDTFFQDDMCYESGFGVRRDIGALIYYFKDYKGKLDAFGIDDYGKIVDKILLTLIL